MRLSVGGVGNHAHCEAFFMSTANRRQWLTQEEAADYLKITPRTVRRMVSSGQLPAFRLGPRLLRIDLADVDALLRRVPTAGGGAA